MAEFVVHLPLRDFVVQADSVALSTGAKGEITMIAVENAVTVLTISCPSGGHAIGFTTKENVVTGT